MNTEIMDDLERQYIDRLDERCTKWQTKHADEAKEIRESVRVQFRRPGGTDPEPGSMPWAMVEAAVNEAIRAKNGWPTFRRWLSERPAVQEYRPPALKPAPAMERHDAKAAAAGDR